MIGILIVMCFLPGHRTSLKHMQNRYRKVCHKRPQNSKKLNNSKVKTNNMTYIQNNRQKIIKIDPQHQTATTIITGS